MVFHAVPGIKDEPTIALRLATVIDVKWDDRKATTRHLVGYDVDHHEGRVSSAIRSERLDDEGVRIFKTHTGREYIILRELPTFAELADATYIQTRWEMINEDIIENIDGINDFIPEDYYETETHND